VTTFWCEFHLIQCNKTRLLLKYNEIESLARHASKICWDARLDKFSVH